MSALPKKITLVACQDMNFGNIGGIGNRNLKEGEEAEFYDTPEIRDLVDKGLLKEKGKNKYPESD
jgi:hypothetical protein